MLRVHTIATLFANAYLIEGERGLVLVDTGPGQCEGAILRRMRALGCDDLQLIVVTHAHIDHCGSAQALHRLTGAPVAVHRADGPALASGQMEAALGRRWQGRLMAAGISRLPPRMRAAPVEPDILLEDGDRLDAYGLDGWVLHTPGHTSGSLCVIAEDGVVFVGDLVTVSPLPRVQRLLASDWSLVASSLARLKALRPERVYCGHGWRPLDGAELQHLRA